LPPANSDTMARTTDLGRVRVMAERKAGKQTVVHRKLVTKLMKLIDALSKTSEEISRKQEPGEQNPAGWWTIEYNEYSHRQFEEAVNLTIELYRLPMDGDPRRQGDFREQLFAPRCQESTEAGGADPIDTLRWLQKVEQEAWDRMVRGEESARPYVLLPALIRICVATATGALVGAPLGAYLVHENIVNEMVKTAAATGVASATAEAILPLSERFNNPRRPQAAAEARPPGPQNRQSPGSAVSPRARRREQSTVSLPTRVSGISPNPRVVRRPRSPGSGTVD
jgi:hypothetical protein